MTCSGAIAWEAIRHFSHDSGEFTTFIKGTPISLGNIICATSSVQLALRFFFLHGALIIEVVALKYLEILGAFDFFLSVEDLSRDEKKNPAIRNFSLVLVL